MTKRRIAFALLDPVQWREGSSRASKYLTLLYEDNPEFYYTLSILISLSNALEFIEFLEFVGEVAQILITYWKCCFKSYSLCFFLYLFDPNHFFFKFHIPSPFLNSDQPNFQNMQ